MKEITNEELKIICTAVLKKFDEICSEHNLKYSLAYGTLIGAVRHSGFIPWDDDIDVIMPRDDYEKLLALKYDDGDYEIKSCRYSDNYYYMFAKMIDKHTCLIEDHIDNKDMGVYIDIFPYDRVSPDSQDFESLVNKCAKFKQFSDHLISSGKRKDSESALHHIVKRVVQSVMKPLRKTIINKFDRSMSKSTGDHCLNLIYNDTYKGNLFSADLWNDLIEVDFEGLKMKAFRDYDQILTKKYGDYMQLPPEEERIGHHGFVAYYKS